MGIRAERWAFRALTVEGAAVRAPHGTASMAPAEAGSIVQRGNADSPATTGQPYADPSQDGQRALVARRWIRQAQGDSRGGLGGGLGGCA